MTSNFESDNQRAYGLLFRIEIALRELLRLEYERTCGGRWQRQLPPELSKTIKASQEAENRPQFDFLRLGPLYYLTFGDLLKVLQHKPVCGVSIRFGGDVFLKQLENLFAPRNAVCHSRPVSSVGLMAIVTLHAQLQTALTHAEFESLLAHPDVGLRQRDFATELLPVLREILDNMGTLPSIFPTLSAVDKASAQFWWADDELAGFNRATIETLAQTISGYNALPLGVGAAGGRQKYQEQHQLQKLTTEAIHELEKLDR
jgi:hypothetical protein